MKGVLNLNKEPGMTSASAVARVRRILGERAVGHMGTLDPQGEGVLLIGVGKATRLFDFYLNKDKVYRATFTFGYATDTLDGDGAVIEDGRPIPEEAALRAALTKSVGAVEQMPPAYSAKSVGGVRAYRLARQGLTPQLTPKRVEIYSAKLLSFRSPAAEVEIHCSSGTYIRSICRDVAAMLGTVATMTAIKRMRCGAFTVDDAVTLTQLETLGARALIPVETSLAELPRVDAPDPLYASIANGVRVAIDAPDEPFTLYCRGELFGLGKHENGLVGVKTNLR